MTMRILLLLTFLVGVFDGRAQTKNPGPANSSTLEWNFPDQSPRRLALELASGNAAEGYQVHDGFWSGTLAKDEPVIVELYLFAGNDYRFSAANVDFQSQLTVSIFDVWGFPAGSEYSGNSSCATAGISVIRSGRYFIRILMTEGDKADACMLYSYK